MSHIYVRHLGFSDVYICIEPGWFEKVGSSPQNIQMCHAIAAHIFGQKQNVTEEEKHSNSTRFSFSTLRIEFGIIIS